MTSDGATDDDAKIDYFTGGTPGIEGWSHGARRSLNDFEHGKLRIDAAAMQMKLLHDLFPPQLWTSDRNQASGKNTTSKVRRLKRPFMMPAVHGGPAGIGGLTDDSSHSGSSFWSSSNSDNRSRPRALTRKCGYSQTDRDSRASNKCRSEVAEQL